MRTWIVSMLVLAFLAGCTDDAPGNEGAILVDDDPAPVVNSLPTFMVSVGLPEGNLTAGIFNVTLAGPENATWSVNLFDANGTAANHTSGAALPANVTFDVAPGNFTFFFAAALEGHEPFELSQNLTFMGGLTAVDPCAAPVVQDAYTFSGTVSSVDGAVDLVFAVGPCQGGLVGSISYLPTAGDIDIELIDASGREVDSAAAFGVTEEDVSASGKPFLLEGDWTYRIVPFASGPGSYDVTITFS